MRISLLDLFQDTYPSGPKKPEFKSVTLPQHTAHVDLHTLRLGDACALLSHGGVAALPQPGESDTAYLQRVIDLLCELSLKDPLTGLANRRHFLAVLERELSIVARSGESTLLLMLDLDHFKHVNDSHGHPVGDKVLQAVAAGLKSCVRPKDTVVRYGGEEFAVVLPDCHVTYGMVVAERMRELVQTMTVPVSPGVNIGVTMSIGGAFASQMIGSKASAWIELADKELYRAKSGGRNRVCIDQPLMVEVSSEEKSLLFVDFSQNDSRWGGSFYGELLEESDSVDAPASPAPSVPSPALSPTPSHDEANPPVKQSAKTQESLG